MKTERLNAKPLSPQELDDLEKLRLLVEYAVKDGRLSPQEMESIKLAIHADGKVLFEELELCRKLIWEKIDEGELEYLW